MLLETKSVQKGEKKIVAVVNISDLQSLSLTMVPINIHLT